MNEELQRFYQGRFILEVWNNQGERIFQKVLKDEVTQWKLHNNTFIFKGSYESPIIYVIYLNEKKMTAVRHPYDDNRGKPGCELIHSFRGGYGLVRQLFDCGSAVQL